MSKNLIREVLNGSYSFPESKSDIEILRNFSRKEQNEVARSEISNFKIYAAACNICSEFRDQLLDRIPLLEQFNNRLCDMQDEYTPSGPPMSPVTKSFFNNWMTLDASIGNDLTIGLLYSMYIREKEVMSYAAKAMDRLNESFLSVYQVVGGDLKKTVVWDILEKREVSASIPIYDYTVATYEPRVGDVWYTRILPPLKDEDTVHQVFGTPLIFRATKREDWERFFARRMASKHSDINKLRKYMKQGDSFGYWLEFVFQTYAGHTGEVIFAEGLPDIKDSRPHGRLDKGRMS